MAKTDKGDAVAADKIATKENREERRQARAARTEGWSATSDGQSMEKMFSFGDAAEATRFSKRVGRGAEKKGSTAATKRGAMTEVHVTIPMEGGKLTKEARALIRRLDRTAKGDKVEEAAAA